MSSNQLVHVWSLGRDVFKTLGLDKITKVESVYQEEQGFYPETL
jgi:hypothetical protein